MNVYDFDETVFVTDSSYCFILYCLRHYPRAVSGIFPASLWQFICYLREGKENAKKLKEALFSFLNRIESVDQVIDSFWDRYFDRIEPWYLKQKKDDDVFISASPEFLLRPVTERLGVHLIATRMDPYSGKIKGRNCHDEEKVRRFLELYSKEEIDAFYSDSLSDSPMAALAKHAYIVTNHQSAPWPSEVPIRRNARPR